MNIKKSPKAQFTAITLQLTPQSITWLNGITHGIHHLTIYRELLFSMATRDISIGKRGIDVPLKPLEVEASANGLGERWSLGRKVMTRLLNEMEQLGLIKISRSKLTSIATMTAVLGYDAIPQTSTNLPLSGSQAEQQDVAQPSSDDDASRVQPTVSKKADCDVCTPAPSAAGDPPSQASVPTDGIPQDKPGGKQHTHTEPTLFGSVDELPESPHGVSDSGKTIV